MALVRWQPANIFDLSTNRLFDSFWGNGNGEAPHEAAFRPSVDIAETNDEYVVTADLPGIDRDDLNVTVAEGRLTLRGERRQNGDSLSGPARSVERVYGTFTRSFELPSEVKADGIGATYRDGVLTVTVPKAAAASENVRRIPVNAPAA